MIYINNKIDFVNSSKSNKKNYVYCDEFNLVNDLKIDNINIEFIDIKNKFNDIIHISKLNKYLSHISKLNNNYIYWSSEISSKNRFTTNIADDFFKNYLLLKEIKNIENSNILIISNDYNLIKSIFKNIDSGLIFKNKFKKTYIYLIKLIFNSKLQLLKKIKNEITIFLKTFFRIILCKIILSSSIKKKNYYCIKTHLYFNNIELLKSKKDIFFGNLESLLIEKKINYFKIAHFHDSFLKSLFYINKNNLKVYPYEYFINIFDLITLFIQKIFYKIKIDNVKIDDLDLSHLIISEYKRSGTSINHLSFYSVAKNISKFYIIEKIFITYENIAWENSFIYGLRKFNKTIKIIGYQHTVVPQAAIGMFSNKIDLEIKPLPDKILTNGVITKEIIKKYSNFSDDFIIPSSALRFEMKYLLNKKKSKIKNILVVLEGIPDVFKLINLVINFSKNNNYNFIIRTHPVLRFSKFKKNLSDFKINNKIIISENNPIYIDFKKSDLCIYWGSAVCLESLSYGIPVVHFDEGKYLSYDPLFKLNYFKWNIDHKFNLKKIIDLIDNMNDEEYFFHMKSSQNYLKDYLYENSTNNIYKFLI